MLALTQLAQDSNHRCFYLSPSRIGAVNICSRLLQLQRKCWSANVAVYSCRWAETLQRSCLPMAALHMHGPFAARTLATIRSCRTPVSDYCIDLKALEPVVLPVTPLALARALFDNLAPAARMSASTIGTNSMVSNATVWTTTFAPAFRARACLHCGTIA